MIADAHKLLNTSESRHDGQYDCIHGREHKHIELYERRSVAMSHSSNVIMAELMCT